MQISDTPGGLKKFYFLFFVIFKNSWEEKDAASD